MKKEHFRPDIASANVLDTGEQRAMLREREGCWLSQVRPSKPGYRVWVLF